MTQCRVVSLDKEVQMVATMPYRWVRGHEFPLPGTYEIDSATSVIDFEVRHLMLTRIQGRFLNISGTISIAERVDESAVAVGINTGRLQLRGLHGDTPEQAIGAPSLEDSPMIAYRSSSVRFAQGTLFIDGLLTIHRTTRPVALIARFRDDLINDWSADRLGFTATARINRDDWEMAWDHSRDHSGLFLGKEVRLSAHIDAIRSNG
jgi:polyisoprenoid-binding protein YceI